MSTSFFFFDPPLSSSSLSTSSALARFTFTIIGAFAFTSSSWTIHNEALAFARLPSSTRSRFNSYLPGARKFATSFKARSNVSRKGVSKICSLNCFLRFSFVALSNPLTMASRSASFESFRSWSNEKMHSRQTISLFMAADVSGF